ncbi:MAG TPA: hypothetical protein VG817_10955, partial [Gemmatimonadales bacterium]|nr:hypothetical protein [Gemmatimonadales bacterium]
MTLAVWATSTSAPLSTCDDAALPGDLKYPNGTAEGQAGWDIAIRFGSAASLPANLKDGIKGRGLIDRLAINAHGDPGHFDLNSQCVSPLLQGNEDIYRKLLSPSNIEPFRPALEGVKALLAANARVLLMGCNSGRGELGTKLLLELSQIWPGREVTAFTTIGASLQRMQAGRFCQIPGMRDTEFEHPAPEGVDRYSNGRINSYPWASHESPHAKTAKDGKLIKDPEPKLGSNTDFIIGTWGWKVDDKPPKPNFIIFRFFQGGTCHWQGYRTAPDNDEALTQVTGKFDGTWSVVGGKVQFQFASDAPNARR